MRIADIDLEYAKLRDDLSRYLLEGGRLAVVKAPPGSGKTYTLIEVLTRLAEGGARIAVAAQTNSQVDDVCLRFAVDHPDVAVARFASRGAIAPDGFPPSVSWVTNTDRLPHGRGVTVATTAKWALTDIGLPYDLLAIDEAWQMGWADLMQCATVSDKFLMIGDPGQIPPVVTIDARRWETSPRAPHNAAPAVVLGEPAFASIRFVGSLPACRRLPCESVDFVRPFYDFDFDAYVPVGARSVGVAGEHPWAEQLGNGRPQVLTIPTPAHGPPIEVDPEIADRRGRGRRRISSSSDAIRFGSTVSERLLIPADIGVTSSHRVMNAALASALGAWANESASTHPSAGRASNGR